MKRHCIPQNMTFGRWFRLLEDPVSPYLSALFSCRRITFVSRIEGGQIFIRHSDPMYRKTAIWNMGAQVEACHASISAGKPGAQANYDAFVKRTRAQVDSLQIVSGVQMWVASPHSQDQQHYKKCKKWSKAIPSVLVEQTNQDLHRLARRCATWRTLQSFVNSPISQR